MSLVCSIVQCRILTKQESFPWDNFNNLKHCLFLTLQKLFALELSENSPILFSRLIVVCVQLIVFFLFMYRNVWRVFSLSDYLCSSTSSIRPTVSVVVQQYLSDCLFSSSNSTRSDSLWFTHTVVRILIISFQHLNFWHIFLFFYKRQNY